MEFFHAAMLAGAATFAIPVVIHLMFRMRRKRIVFSSLQFLQQSVLKHTQRLRVREILLLLLRCAACILIALAFARPFRPDSALAGPGGKPQEDIILVVDDSPSLLAQEAAAIRWNTLLDKVRREIDTHPSGDRVGLVLASEPSRAEIEPSGNFGAIKAALQKERPSYKRGDLAQSLNTAIEMLATSQQPLRRIVLYSDLQSNAIERGAWAEAAQKAAAAGRGITIQLESPGDGKPSRLPNLAITDVRPKSDVWIEGRPIPFAVRVANHGDADVSALTVKLMVDGKPLATRIIGLGPRSSSEFELSAPMPRAGEVAGVVEIEAHDAFPEDDKRRFAVRLRDSMKAVVIEERLNERDPFLDEGYYVRMALDPRPRGPAATEAPGAGSGYVRVESIPLAKLSPDKLRDADLIVLVGIIAMQESELSLLEEAVASGKNLILFAGNSHARLSEHFYNGSFWKSGRGLLPARPGPYYEGNTLEGKYHQIGEFKVEHTLFKPFVGENEAHLRLPRFIRHYQPNPADLKIGSEAQPEGKPPRAAGELLASFLDGSPFAMERSFGKGSVLMFPFSPRPEATTLPERKVFVPLIHQAVRHFAGVTSVSRRNLTIGESFDFADVGASPEANVALELPLDKSGRKEVLNLTGKDHPSAEVSGTYTAAFQKGSLHERTLWAANIDARESDLSSEDAATLRTVFASNNVERSATAASNVEWDNERKAQAPDWRYFLVAALLCLLLELWLRDFWK